MMALPPFGWFLAAVLLLIVAHQLRTIRWRIVLQNCGIEVSNLRPFAALSVGYLINMLIPFRLGDVIRAAILARGARARFSTVIASVVLERLIDLFAVALLAVLVIRGPEQLFLGAWSLGLGVIVFSGVYLVHRYATSRRIVWWLASIFNDAVKSGILNFIYVVSALVFVRPLLSSARFWMMTGLMWACYLVSLGCLSMALDQTLGDLFQTIYFSAIRVAPSLSLGGQDVWLVCYLLLPLLVILAYAGIMGRYALEPLARALHAATDLRRLSRPPVVSRSQLFWSADQYNAFLDRRYKGTGGLLSEFEERGIDSVRLFRVFHGGSGAITALVEVEGKLRVRKFATDAMGEKLKVQYDWLNDHRDRLPMVTLLGQQGSAGDFAYDMAYVGGSRDVYEAIHTDPIDSSIALLDDVIGKLERFHADTATEDADDATLAAYLDAKVVQNFARLRAEFADLFDMGSIEINGSAFDLSSLDILASSDWLAALLTDRRQSVIHGDLTIENIMIEGAGDGRWFLIDPNPVNGFQTPFIDYAKLLQSLHLGYEALHEAPRAKLVGNKLRVGLHRSFQYDAIYEHLLGDLRARFGDEGLKQILLHEWINYLRLIPYQLRVSREAGLTFFGCLCLLVHEFRQAYPEDFR